MPAKRAATRPIPKRSPLSRERITKAALDIADREGVDQLSMRRLAESLGAGTMTLYGHFANKGELLDAVLDLAASEKKLPGFEGTWREQIHQLVGHARDLHRRHPGVVDIWSRQPALGRRGLRWPEAGMRILEGAGFATEEAALAFRLIANYTWGFALFSAPRSGAGRESTQSRLAALPEDRFPHLRNAAESFAAAMGSEESFVYGLERILDGFQAKLESP
ncbi:MAG TPA: TetR/AcrR family transcriptional regulator C-terminal domain-containing protein [Actinomycetota bacterium]|nr:TetR/AcrR family transcriptional regulator C-terminal domain-containing protein [Actinomycetota bacterium]